MPIIKIVSVPIKVSGAAEAQLQIGKVSAAADKLAAANPTITPQIDSAKALLQARLLRAGITAELANAGSGAGGGGGLFSKLLGTGGSGGTTLASVAGSPVGIAAITAAGSALVVEIAAVVSGFAAATAGVGAFGILAIPTITKITAAVTAIGAATTKAQLAKAWDAVPRSLVPAVQGVLSLKSAFDKLAASMQPQVLKVFNDGLKIANALLPALLPFAKAAAAAIDGLLSRFAKFAGSSGFKGWLAQFSQLSGPAITAIGTGIGKIINDVGKLLTRFSAHDVTHAINFLVDPIVFGLTAIRNTIGWLMTGWDAASHAIEAAWRKVAFSTVQVGGIILQGVRFIVGQVLNLFKAIVDGAAKAFGWVPGIGGKLRTAAAAFDRFAAGVIGSLASAQAAVGSLQASLDGLHGKTIYVNTVINSVPGPVRGHQAAGGYTALGWNLVGEQGPELIAPPQGSYVYNHQQTAALLSGQSPGNTYNINVYVPVSANKRQTGADIVEAIREFEQGSGHGWRK